MKERIEKYLRLMRKNFIWVDSINSFLVQENILNEKVEIIVRIMKNHVQIMLPVLKLSDLDNDKKFYVLQTALITNHILSNTEFEYSDRLDMLLISNELLDEVVSFDLFEISYNSIIIAVNTFFRAIRSEIKDFKYRFIGAFEPLRKALNLISKRTYRGF